MILNGLGFVSSPLYLFSEFFEGKPVAPLLGPGITASHLNDDRLGRVLDQLFEYGTTLFFFKVAMQAVERFGVSVSHCHLDSTSFGLDGEYPSVNGSEEEWDIKLTLVRPLANYALIPPRASLFPEQILLGYP
jgi:transposase